MTNNYRITSFWANNCPTWRPLPGDFINLLHSKRRTQEKLELNKRFYIYTSQSLVTKSLVQSSSSDEATVSTAVAKFAPLTGKYTYKQLRLLPVRN